MCTASLSESTRRRSAHLPETILLDLDANMAKRAGEASCSTHARREVAIIGFVNVRTDNRGRATTVRFSSRET